MAFIWGIFFEFVTRLAALSLWENEGGVNRKLLLVVVMICPCLHQVKVVKSPM